MCERFFLCVAIVAGFATTAMAQDVVHLKDGEVLAGKLTDGMLSVQVETPRGEVRIPWNRIDRIDRGSYVRQLFLNRKAELGAEDAAAHFLLALWCRRQGLSEQMKSQLTRVLEIDPEHPGARSALGFTKVDERWVAGDQALVAKGFVRQGDRWILEEEAAHARMVKERDRPFTDGEMKAEDLIVKAADENLRVATYAREVLAGVSWDDLRIPLYRALAHQEPAVRAFVAAELGRLGEVEGTRLLLRSAVLDTSPLVREAAVGALREFGRPGILMPLARALASVHPRVRRNAAAAIGGYGDIRGVEYVLLKLSQNWGPTQRNNIQVLNQVTYVRDFDVEIAQAAQIGDPIVGVLCEGVILDFQVLSVNRTIDLVERRVLYGALRNLTGKEFGEDRKAWAAWWKENRESLLAEAK